MKKRLLFALILLAGSLQFLWAQGNRIMFNPQVGSTMQYRYSQVSDLMITAAGQSMPNKSTVKNDVEIKVEEKRGENFLLAIKLLQVSADMVTPQGSFTGSSQDEKENSINKPLKEMVGKLFQVEVTPQFDLVGKVTPITEGLTQKKAEELYEGIKSIFSGIYPLAEVDLADTWDAVMAQGSQAHCTLVSSEDNQYTIEGTLTYKGNMQGVDMEGKGTICYTLHQATGLPAKISLNLPISGNAFMGVQVEVKGVIQGELLPL